MKWVTREKARVDRIACPWLISRFVDKEPTFLFVPPAEVMGVAKREAAIPYDVPGVELGHHGERCSFDAFLDKYELDDPALGDLALIVRGADTDARTLTPESAGLYAAASGFRAHGRRRLRQHGGAVPHVRRAVRLLPRPARGGGALMPGAGAEAGWLVLIVSLPPHPSSLRVRAWRKLRAHGRGGRSGAACISCRGARAHRAFEWLPQEIQRDGGEATLLKVDRIENMQPAGRDPPLPRGPQPGLRGPHRALPQAAKGLEGGDGPRGGEARGRDAPARAARSSGSPRSISSRRRAAGRRARVQETVEDATGPPGRARQAGAAPPPRLTELRGRRWATRPRPHVDRIASAWLIKRFVTRPPSSSSPRPRTSRRRDPVRQARRGVRPSGRGLHVRDPAQALTGLRDRKLAILAEIVHEADLSDEQVRARGGPRHRSRAARGARAPSRTTTRRSPTG